MTHAQSAQIQGAQVREAHPRACPPAARPRLPAPADPTRRAGGSPDRSRAGPGHLADARRRAATARAPGLLRLAGLLLAAALPLAALSGCASSATTYYSLAAVPGIPAPGGPSAVEVRQPGIAGYLDRNSIVRGGDDYRLDVASTQAWGEPMSDMIGRVLAQDLAERLPGTEVTTSQGVISSHPPVRVELQVNRFDSGRDNVLTLAAQLAILRGESSTPVATRSIRLTTQTASKSAEDLVASMSRLLGQLADQAAGLLRAGA